MLESTIYSDDPELHILIENIKANGLMIQEGVVIPPGLLEELDCEVVVSSGTNRIMRIFRDKLSIYGTILIDKENLEELIYSFTDLKLKEGRGFFESYVLILIYIYHMKYTSGDFLSFFEKYLWNYTTEVKVHVEPETWIRISQPELLSILSLISQL